MLLFANDMAELGELRAAVDELGGGEVEAVGPEGLIAQKELEVLGITRLYTLGSWNDLSAESLGKILAQLIESSKAEIILGISRKITRDIFARAAQILSSPCLTDCVTLAYSGGKLIAERPTLGGAYIERQLIKRLPVLLTIQERRRQFAPRESKKVERFELDNKVRDLRAPRRVASEAIGKSGVDLGRARIIVSVGRGFKKKEDLKIAEELAKVLGGEVACSRPIASDLGWMPEERHVGLSGKWVSPSLYFAIGISGQVQHMVGVRNSKIIVAVNKDPSAPIHREADYSVIADLYEFVPKFVDMVRSKGARLRG